MLAFIAHSTRPEFREAKGSTGSTAEARNLSSATLHLSIASAAGSWSLKFRWTRKAGRWLSKQYLSRFS